jgi:hypothetical protein
MQDTAFQNKLRCRWDFLRTNIISDSSLFHYIDSVALYLNQAQARHFLKWGNLGLNTGTPEMEPDPTTFAGEIAQFKGWIARRTLWLDANIPGTCNLGVTVAVKKETEDNIAVYPNPATNSITIKGKYQLTNIKIFDVTGREVLQTSVISNQATININQLSKGIYFVRIATSIGTSNCKFVKE